VVKNNHRGRSKAQGGQGADVQTVNEDIGPARLVHKGRITIQVHAEGDLYLISPVGELDMSNTKAPEDEFYVRYYVGHKGKFGHEFLEFEFRPNGKLRYANNSRYKQETIIRKEVFVSNTVRRELKKNR
jgi:hypothetical protein